MAGCRENAPRITGLRPQAALSCRGGWPEWSGGVLALSAHAINHQPLAGHTEGCVEPRPPLPPGEAKAAGVWTVA